MQGVPRAPSQGALPCVAPVGALAMLWLNGDGKPRNRLLLGHARQFLDLNPITIVGFLVGSVTLISIVK